MFSSPIIVTHPHISGVTAVDSSFNSVNGISYEEFGQHTIVCYNFG